MAKKLGFFMNMAKPASNMNRIIYIKKTFLKGCIFLIALAFVFLLSGKVSADTSSPVQVWWPVEGATVSGVQPFKAMLSGKSVYQYKMYWQVDGGGLVEMHDAYADYPHKEASVDVSGWNWNGSKPYKITIVAKNYDGSTIEEKSVWIKIPQKTGAAPLVSSPAPVQAKLISTSVGSLGNSVLYVDADSQPAHSVAALRDANRLSDALLMNKIASSPVARWFGNWNSNIYGDVNSYVRKANGVGTIPVLVAYNIPSRDCGGYSGGGSNSPQGYKDWIMSFANGIGDDKAIVILEPDALPQMDCLSSSAQSDRLSLISFAINTLKAKAHTLVYVDAGNPTWKSASDIASRLKSAGVGKADGFSLNVSNFISLDENKKYGNAISALLGGTHFVIDTSRNGSGGNGQWCNPWGRSLGMKPTLSTGEKNIDAYLWIKAPGESDGTCNGGPNAGVFWENYALDLARNASW